jgi:Trypsin-like peptidase domain
LPGPLDLAVVQVLHVEQPLWPMTLCPYDVLPGSTILVVGHAVFNPAGGLRPSVSWGTVAQVVSATAAGAPEMLITTATVHAGARIGATGRLVVFALACMPCRPCSAAPVVYRSTQVSIGCLEPAGVGGECVCAASGASGGALVTHSGSLAGLVTSNANHSATGEARCQWLLDEARA